MTFRFLRNLAAISLAEVCAFAVPRKNLTGIFVVPIEGKVNNVTEEI